MTVAVTPTLSSIVLSGAGAVTATGIDAGTSGVGRIELPAVRTLRASVSGNGSITYEGHPHVTSTVSGVGEIHAADLPESTEEHEPR